MGADHTPPALDDQFKKIDYDKLTKAFNQLSPEVMLKAIPVTMPMTNLATAGGKTMKGIAKYPIDAWELNGNPCFTSHKWALMCLSLAEVGRAVALTRDEEKIFEKLFLAAEKV